MSQPPSQDPIQRHGAALLGIVLAIIASLFVSALVASQFGDDYSTRAWTYVGLLLWSVVGGVVMFLVTKDAPTQDFSAGRVAQWFVSVWLWPVFAWLARGRGPSSS